uniref:Ymf58 n=1 Tax=Ichthyophthirius multifiliis TaxID=5932 RepID=G1FLD2_ICHMU|nr:Ymf58 [Ichthyophthirius multifiliis]AEL89274.1 Ymf58 [Ichthyophthirius multifiliis]
MLSWFIFLNILFWLIIINLILKFKNFLTMLLMSELIWILIYTLSVYIGIIYSDILIISITFFILCFSGIEFSIGIILSILYKNLNESLNLNSSLKSEQQTNYFKNFKNFKNII